MADINNRLEVLLRWVNTFNLPKKVFSTDDVRDGVLLLKMLKYLAPNYFIYPIMGDSILAQDVVKRFEHIMTGLNHFCTIEFGYRQDFAADFPNVSLFEGGRAEDWVTLLKLVLLSSSRSVRKKECIQRMRVMEKEDLQELVQMMREAMAKYCAINTKVSSTVDSSPLLSPRDAQPTEETCLSKTTDKIIKLEENPDVKKRKPMPNRNEYLQALLNMMDNGKADRKNVACLTGKHRIAWESEESTAVVGGSTGGLTERTNITAEDKEDYTHKLELLRSQAQILRYSLTASSLKFDLLSQIGRPDSITKSPFEDLSEEMAGLSREMSGKNDIIRQLHGKVCVAQEEALCWKKRYKALVDHRGGIEQPSPSWNTRRGNDKAGSIAKSESDTDEDFARMQLEALKAEIDDVQNKVDSEKRASQAAGFDVINRNLDSINELEEDDASVSIGQQQEMWHFSEHELAALKKELSSYQRERDALKRKLDETRYNVKMLEDFVRYTREETKPAKSQSAGQVSKELKEKIAVLKEELTETISQTTNNKIIEAFNQQTQFLNLLTKNLKQAREPKVKGEDLKSNHEELKELLVTIKKSSDKDKAEVRMGQSCLPTS